MKVRALSLTILILFANFVHSQKPVPMPTVPDRFEVSIFAQPPAINYPVCLTAALTGEVFVGIDKQGSLGKKKGQGRVERCVDTDGDGKADQFNTFAVMDHPRGLIYDQGKLWVLHPPNLSLYHDDNLDGKADRSETLVTGLTTDFLNKRGADHTTNGIRMGIDGWIYIAVGDFGFVNAKGKDGRTLTLRGGGIVRVRPDGTEMEIFCRGLRNIYDVSIDPQLNIFTRDNTNDGGGWDIRLSHIVQSANYGYPSLFKNFGDEILPPLADYGGGSGCGSMFLSEPMFPSKYQHALLTCDWGRNTVFYHPLTKNGATWKAGQEDFVKLPRPTDIDVDGSGRLYISSWHNGKFNYAGEDIGYVAQVIPKGLKTKPFPNLSKATEAELLTHLQSDSHKLRFHTQREILRRGSKVTIVNSLKKVMQSDATINAKVAAIFTFKQLLGSSANAELIKIATNPTVTEYALRALTDRTSQLKGVTSELFTKSLKDNNPRVQLAALIGIGRLGNKDAGKAVLQLANPPEVATKPTVKTAAYRSGIMGKKKRSVRIRADITGAKKLFLVVTDGGDGLGLDHAAWVNPLLVGSGTSKKLTEMKWTSAKAGWGNVHVNRDCQNKPLRFQGKPIVDALGTHAHSVIEYQLPDGFTSFQARGILDDGSNKKGSVRFYVFTDELPSTYQKASATVVKDVSKYVLPHVAVKTLVKLNAVDACLSALDGPQRPGVLFALRYMHDPKAVSGLISKLKLTRNEEFQHQLLQTLIRLYHKEGPYKATWWGTRPDTTGPYYERVTWSETERIENVLRNRLLASNAKTVKMMLSELVRHRVTLKNLPPDLAAKAQERNTAPSITVTIPPFDKNNPNQLGNIPYEQVLSRAMKVKGNLLTGAKLFKQQSCHACHTTAPGQPTIGPSLLDIGERYNRTQLLESILKPSAQLAQGFATSLFEMDNGKSHTGFVVREAADEIEIRTAKGQSILLPKKQIDERIEIKQSIMPEGIVNNLTMPELASLVDYLNSLRTKKPDKK